MEKKTQKQKDCEALKARRERLRVVADEVLDSVEALEKATTAIEATPHRNNRAITIPTSGRA